MDFKWVSSEDELAEAFRVRREVFVEEHEVPQEFEFDEDDHRAQHLLALSKSGRVAGTARLLPSPAFPGFAKIARVSVLRDYRRQQLASRMVSLLEHRAKLTGYRGVEVAAIADVRPFYRKLGYVAYGPFFPQSGIRHQGMSKLFSRRVVVAVGGNAVVDGFPSVLRTAEKIVDLTEAGWEVVLTHGNGPQVGAALLRSEATREKIPPHSLAMCVAETQGTLGYQFCQALNKFLEERGREPLAVSVITQTEVDPKDPAFSQPTKPIGGFMTAEEAEQRRQDQGWQVMEDSGRGWRRVVASPLPTQIVQAHAVRTLLDAGYLAVASGGGGIPTDSNGDGVDAVIDKDRTAALLAREVEADALLIATAVPNAYTHFGTEQQKKIGRISLDDVRTCVKQGHFGAGSMKPKVEACIDFLSYTANTAIITDIDSLEAGLRLETGTCIDPYF